MFLGSKAKTAKCTSRAFPFLPWHPTRLHFPSHPCVRWPYGLGSWPMKCGWKWHVHFWSWRWRPAFFPLQALFLFQLVWMELIPRVSLDLFVEGGQVHEKEDSVSLRRAMQLRNPLPNNTQLDFSISHNVRSKLVCIKPLRFGVWSVTAAVRVSLAMSKRLLCLLKEGLKFYKEKKHSYWVWLLLKQSQCSSL